MGAETDQSGSQVGGHMIGRDQTNIEKLTVVIRSTEKAQSAPSRRRAIDGLYEKLRREMATDQRIEHTVDRLNSYYTKISPDGIVGLEQKLSKAGREHEIVLALEKKERFVKFLEQWSLYLSAQEIIARLLAKAESVYNFKIYPRTNVLSEAEINTLILIDIVDPIVEEYGSDVFALDHGIVCGMVYWLAEQCFVRWHK